MSLSLVLCVPVVHKLFSPLHASKAASLLLDCSQAIRMPVCVLAVDVINCFLMRWMPVIELLSLQSGMDAYISEQCCE